MKLLQALTGAQRIVSSSNTIYDRGDYRQPSILNSTISSTISDFLHLGVCVPWFRWRFVFPFSAFKTRPHASRGSILPPTKMGTRDWWIISPRSSYRRASPLGWRGDGGDNQHCRNKCELAKSNMAGLRGEFLAFQRAVALLFLTFSLFPLFPSSLSSFFIP